MTHMSAYFLNVSVGTILTPRFRLQEAPMKVAQILKPNAGFEVVERPVPEPQARQVRIKVQACGVCHSDMLTVVGAIPGIEYPRVPGHEVVGLIAAVGADVPDWKKGMRV